VAGITDEKTRIKRPVSDSRITPRTVIADPTLTLETPAWLWAASGIRALDHAIESIYSVRHYPVSDAAASSGLTMLLKHLKPSLDTDGPRVLEHRGECQLAAWMCVFGVTNAGFGLSHALGHQIGPRWDVPHGMTSCITLPHAMRFMADLAPERFRPIAEGFGVAFDPAEPRRAALACADRAAAFIAQFDVPQRLRDVGVPRDELAEVAAIVHDVMDAAHVVDRLVTKDDIVTLLTNAY
jgi:alcohol dehydrogenase